MNIPGELSDEQLADRFLSLSRHLNDQPDPDAAEELAGVRAEAAFRFADRVHNRPEPDVESINHEAKRAYAAFEADDADTLHDAITQIIRLSRTNRVDYTETYGRAVAISRSQRGIDHTVEGEVAHVELEDNGTLTVHLRDDDAPGGGLVSHSNHTLILLDG